MRRTMAFLLAAAVATAAGGCVMKSEHDKVLGELAATKTKLVTGEKDLAATRGSLAETQTDLTSTKSTLATTEATLQTTKDSLSVRESSLKTARDALASSQQAKAAVEARCALAEADNRRLRDGLSELVTKCLSAARRLKGAESSLVEVRTNGGRVATALNELTQRVTAQGTAIGALEAAFKPLGGEIAELIRQAGVLGGAKAGTPPARTGNGGETPKTP